MELRFPIFGSVPDSNGNAIAVPIRYCNRNDYLNELGIDPLTVKIAVLKAKWFKR